MCYASRVTWYVSRATCHVLCVTCHLIPVTYHLSLIPTATDPHPANSPTMHSRLVHKNQKPKKVEKRKNFVETQFFSNISNTLFDQKSPVLSVPVVGGGEICYIDIATTRLNLPRGRFSENSFRPDPSTPLYDMCYLVSTRPLHRCKARKLTSAPFGSWWRRRLDWGKYYYKRKEQKLHQCFSLLS